MQCKHSLLLCTFEQRNNPRLEKIKEPLKHREMDVEFCCYTLPQEIIRDILTRLPVKSLIRFESVARGFSNLFKTPNFIADHLHHSTHNNPSLLLRRFHRSNPYSHPPSLCLLESEMKQLEIHNPPLINFMSNATIVGSCNGLLCVRHTDGGSSDMLSLWNPATRDVRQLPGTKITGTSCVGFGYCSVLNDYKIVRIQVSESNDENGILDLDKVCVARVDVYSLSTESWKEIKRGNLESVYLNYDTVTANGAMFWLASEVGELDDQNMVVSFDMALEEFTQIPLPASATKSDHNKLTVYKDSLAMFSLLIIGNFESTIIDLWVMKDIFSTGGSWTKEYTVGPFSGIMRPLRFWRDDIVCEVEMPKLIAEAAREVEHDGQKTFLSLFSPSVNELKNLPSRQVQYWYSVFNFVESLVPVGNIRIEE